MSEVKYIIVEKNMESMIMYYPFIFEKNISHKAFYESMVELMNLHFDSATVKCVSAGFYNTTSGKCFGDSETLKIGTHPEATKIFFQMGTHTFYDKKSRLIKKPIILQ